MRRTTTSSFLGAFLGSVIGGRRGGPFARGLLLVLLAGLWLLYSWVVTHPWVLVVAAAAGLFLVAVRYDRRHGQRMTWPGAGGRRCAVYRLYDRDGALLYVGIAFDPDIRLAQHTADRDKDWWFWRYEQGGRRTVQWLSSREEAKALESDVIKGRTGEARPLFNRAENGSPA